jgi:diadenosine tetraphosphatase ApaH/serine/threonine PP2A family protein phosphatase
VIADTARRGVESVINLGDCVSGPLWPRETCEMLIELGWPTVRGICDREVGLSPRDRLDETDAFAWDRLDDSHRKWLAELPAAISLSNLVLACHGTPLSDYLLDSLADGQLCAHAPDVIGQRRCGSRAALTLCGHSHVPRLCAASDGRIVLNPSSAGLPAYASVWDNTRLRER